MHNDQNNSSRGSEWRKWDLQIHPPGTKGSDQYKIKNGNISDSWNLFLKKIKTSDVKVFGITDYFSLDGYENLIEKIKGNNDFNEKVFFPNIEFRLDVSLNQTIEQLQCHLIFDNQCDVKKIKNFLSHLPLKNKKPDGSLSYCIDTDINACGGYDRVSISIEDLKQALEDNFGDDYPFLKVGVSSGMGSLRAVPNSKVKKELADEFDKFCDFFFGSVDNRDYYLQTNRYENKDIKSIPKAVVSTSDCHSFSDLDNFLGKQFINTQGKIEKDITWIKADKTFEGLKQIIYEARERVFIGDKPDKLVEVESNRSKYIDSIKIEHINPTQTSGWFNNEIPLNSGLVAVIGRKGQGKSAFTDIISFCSRTKIALSDYSFLRKDKFRKKGFAKDYSATLKWCNGTPITENLDAEVNITEVEKVKYLPQKYVETICNDDGVSPQFQKEIDKVIFSYIPEEGRLDTANLGDLINVKTGTIDGKISQIRIDLHSVNERIVKLEGKKQPQYLESLKKKLTDRQEELKSLVKPKVISPPKTKLKKSDQTKLNRVRNEVEEIIKKIDSAKVNLKTTNDNLNKLNNLKAAVDQVTKNSEKIIKDFADDAKLLSIDLSKLISVRVDDKIFQRIENKLVIKKKSLEELLDQSDEPSPKSLYTKKTNLEAQKDSIISVFGEDEKIYSKYQTNLKEYLLKKKMIEGKADDLTLESIKSIESEINYLKRKLNVDLTDTLNERFPLVDKLYSELQQKSDFYKDTYRPLLKFIDGEKKTQEESGSVLGFDAGIIFDKGSFPARFLGYINQNRNGSFQYTDRGQKILDKIIEKADFTNSDKVKEFINELIDHLEYDKTQISEAKNNLRSQLKDGDQENIDFYDFIFGLSYLDVKYKVLFSGKDLNSNEFSPGEKGALLLIFYLLIDKDRIPLVMDQPEENLDNESVYELLVPYIRKAKLKRQIIIVTHNPNLAVVCDAEQIVAASMNKKKNQIRYTSGSIENPKMNKKAADVLEGTLPAFDIRDEKYIRTG